MNCDKCGEPVERTNDAVRIHMTAYPEEAVSLITATARHFLPTNTCPGSPSRAQYIDGRPRDPRYTYVQSHEAVWRAAYAQVQAEGNS